MLKEADSCVDPSIIQSKSALTAALKKLSAEKSTLNFFGKTSLYA